MRFVACAAILVVGCGGKQPGDGDDPGSTRRVSGLMSPRSWEPPRRSAASLCFPPTPQAWAVNHSRMLAVACGSNRLSAAL